MQIQANWLRTGLYPDKSRRGAIIILSFSDASHFTQWWISDSVPMLKVMLWRRAMEFRQACGTQRDLFSQLI